jgi:small subunit ribosomal protein S2
MATNQAELVKALIDAGVHFGHRVSRWNPKMEPYIHGKRNMIHIIDVRRRSKAAPGQAPRGAERQPGKDVLFVGPSARHDTPSKKNPSLRHALCLGALAGRHADQLPHHPSPSAIVSRSSRSCSTTGQIETYSKKMKATLGASATRSRPTSKASARWTACRG